MITVHIVLRPFTRITAIPATLAREVTSITLIMVDFAVRTGRIANPSSVRTALLVTFILALISIAASAMDIVYGASLSKKAKKLGSGEQLEMSDIATSSHDIFF